MKKRSEHHEGLVERYSLKCFRWGCLNCCLLSVSFIFLFCSHHVHPQGIVVLDASRLMFLKSSQVAFGSVTSYLTKYGEDILTCFMQRYQLYRY